jgi:hypothetical protein
MKHALTVLLIAAALGGCGVPVRQGDGQYGVQQQKVTVINGIPLTPVSAGRSAFPRGKFNGFPIIAEKSDLAALDALARDYAKAAWQAAARQDWEGFEVNRHLGARIVEYRMHGKIATTDFVKSIVAGGDGSGSLTPGATVFLSGFTRDGATTTAAAKLSSIDAITARLASNESAEFTLAWADAPKVAQLSALSGILDTGAALLNTAAKLGGATTTTTAPQSAAQQKAEADAARMPIGTVFSGKDVNGNSFLVERTPTGFIVGNSGHRPTRVPLGKLGFLPEMPLPDANRRAAAPLVMAMQESDQTLFWQVMNSGKYAKPVSTAKPPNKIVIINTPIVGYLDAAGRLTSDSNAIAAGAAAYTARKEYKTALEMVDYLANKSDAFEAQCFSMVKHKAYAISYTGEFAEILQHRCLDANRVTIWRQNFYVKDGKTMQTFESLMKDQAIADALKNFDAAADLAELAAGFVPGLGTVDAGAKCLTGQSITNFAAGGFATGNEQYRAFVSDLMPPIDTPSAWSKTLTCTAAVPGVGVAVKVAAKAGKALGGSYRAWHATDKALSVAEKLDFFDSNVLAVGNFASLSGANGLAETSLAAGKKLYDVAQAISTGTDATGAATTLLN